VIRVRFWHLPILIRRRDSSWITWSIRKLRHHRAGQIAGSARPGLGLRSSAAPGPVGIVVAFSD
jgi:hypothetical protein